MAKEHDLEIRFQAEELFVECRVTHEEIAERLDIGLSTVRRWSTDGDWKTLREEHFERRRMLKSNLAKLRENMMERAASNLDPQDVYAVIRLEKLARERESKGHENTTPDVDLPKIFLENLEWIARALQETDPEGFKVLARNFDYLTDKFKTECLDA
jgi:transposase